MKHIFGLLVASAVVTGTRPSLAQSQVIWGVLDRPSFQTGLRLSLMVLAVVSTTACCPPILEHADEHHSTFPIFDNMFYTGKPDTAEDGLLACNILYENNIWPKKDFGVLPGQGTFAAVVRSHTANPGPLVIDIEALPLNGPHDVARRNMKVLATLADWAREAAPGRIIGYYGTNTLSRVPPANLDLARELARHVDAFFPSMYTFNDDRQAWEKRAKELVAESHELDPHKPVYFYLWPQYHDHTPQEFQYIDEAFWKFQLELSYRLSDGIVLWSPGKYAWDDSSGWWRATVRFARALDSASTKSKSHP